MDRVLFVVNAAEYGGLEVVLLDWLSGVDYLRTEVAVCYQADALKGKIAAANLPVKCIPLTLPLRESIWKTYRRWRRLFGGLHADKIILLEGNLGDWSLPQVLAGRRSARCVFAFAGGGGPSVSRKSPNEKYGSGAQPGIGLYSYRQSLKHRLRSRLLQHTFVASNDLKDAVTKCFAVRPDRVSVLHHGIDTQRFRPCHSQRIAFRQEHGIPEDATVIVSHGRLAPIKRVDRIVKAFETLHSERKNLWLLLTAYGSYREQVQKICDQSVAARHIKLVGFQEDASRVLKASDIYVLASDREGFGIALIEAMSTGLICVATNCGGPADILSNGENGLLVEPSAEGVLNGLRHALTISPAARSRIATRARETVEKRFEIGSAIHHALDSMQIPRC